MSYYTGIEARKLAAGLSMFVCRVARSLQRVAQDELTSPHRRAACSIPACLPCGACREGNRVRSRFLRVSPRPDPGR